MSIIEFIRDRARFYNCPVCGRSLKGCDIQVLSHEHERFHLQVTCAQCQVTFIVVLAIAGGAVEEVESVETTTGATSSRAEAAVQEPDPISVDEILDVLLEGAGPIFHAVMSLLEGPWLSRPGGIDEVEVCAETGLLPGPRNMCTLSTAASFSYSSADLSGLLSSS